MTKILLAIATVLILAMLVFAVAWWMMIRMPGQSHMGELPALTADQVELRGRLRGHVEHLAGQIGERNLHRYPALVEAAQYIEDQFVEAGYDVERQEYKVAGLACHNLIVEIPGAGLGEEIVVVGAHYDSFLGTPAANDNASGVAALVALARAFAGRPVDRTLRFVAFTNEEPPYFQTPDMGSWVYARRCRQRDENVVAMLSLETIGYYRDEPSTQQYPAPFDRFYPHQGDFIAVIGDVGSRRLVRQVVESFRRHSRFPSEGGAIPASVPGAGWSDHWSFWQESYAAVMITDTALFRYPYYHHPEDTPDKLDYNRMVRVVDGLRPVIAELAKCKTQD